MWKQGGAGHAGDARGPENQQGPRAWEVQLQVLGLCRETRLKRTQQHLGSSRLDRTPWWLLAPTAPGSEAQFPGQLPCPGQMPTVVHNPLLWAAPSWVQHQGLPMALGTAAGPGLQAGPCSQGAESSTNTSCRQVSGTHHVLHGGPSPEDDGVCEVRPLCTGRDGVGVNQSWPHATRSFPQGTEALPVSSLGLASPLFSIDSLIVEAHAISYNLDLITDRDKCKSRIQTACNPVSHES